MVQVNFLLRIILYPICLGIGIWCAVQFKEGFEGKELRRYLIDNENPGELIKKNKAKEESTEEESTEEESTEEEFTEEEFTEEEFTEEESTEEVNDSANDGDNQIFVKSDEESLNYNVKTNGVGDILLDNEENEGGLMGYFAGMIISILTFAFFVA